MLKKKSLALTFGMLLTTLISCGAAAAAEYNWRFAHEEYNGSMQDVYVKEFVKLLHKKSGGRINVEVYPVGQIGDATQQCELLQNGGLEFAIISPGNTGTIVPENQLFSLHFLFSEDMNKTMELFRTSKALNEMLSAKYKRRGIKVLAYWQEGFMQWTSNRPLRSPEDFKGLKFRTMPSPMIVAAYKAYGANPTPLAYLEVYSALQLKMIDGQENPISAIEESKFYEVQKYLTEANSNIYVTATCVNPDFFEGLPADIKKIVLETVEEMRPRSKKIVDNLNGAALKKIQSVSKIKVEKLTDKERSKFAKASKSAYDVYKKMVGKDGAAILDKLMEEIAAMK